MPNVFHVPYVLHVSDVLKICAMSYVLKMPYVPYVLNSHMSLTYLARCVSILFMANT